MRIPRALRAAALTAAAVLLGLLVVQGSYALWNATAPAAPGTVNAASFDVTITGAPSTQSMTMTTPAGQQASLALTTQTNGLSALTPGSAAYASVTAANNSDAGGPFSISLTAGIPQKVNAGSGTLADYLTVRAKNASLPADCTSAAGYQVPAGAGITSGPVAKTRTTIMCFEVTLSASAPTSVKGQSVTITVPLTASQL
ncbi:hypothetical protein [Arthrobacter sp. NPDC056493]|uniref:hypothetical protein n=1 Tax=Arthrobacter sp. NPDC056493 TaxID=3345839 RepID=UPI0036735AFC